MTTCASGPGSRSSGQQATHRPCASTGSPSSIQQWQAAQQRSGKSVFKPAFVSHAGDVELRIRRLRVRFPPSAREAPVRVVQWAATPAGVAWSVVVRDQLVTTLCGPPCDHLACAGRTCSLPGCCPAPLLPRRLLTRGPRPRATLDQTAGGGVEGTPQMRQRRPRRLRRLRVLGRRFGFGLLGTA